jgi:hypothetical protein
MNFEEGKLVVIEWKGYSFLLVGLNDKGALSFVCKGHIPGNCKCGDLFDL